MFILFNVSWFEIKEMLISFQFSNELERNKLFVSGLPRSATKTDLHKLFGKVSLPNKSAIKIKKRTK